MFNYIPFQCRVLPYCGWIAIIVNEKPIFKVCFCWNFKAFVTWKPFISINRNETFSKKMLPIMHFPFLKTNSSFSLNMYPLHGLGTCSEIKLFLLTILNSNISILNCHVFLQYIFMVTMGHIYSHNGIAGHDWWLDTNFPFQYMVLTIQIFLSRQRPRRKEIDRKLGKVILHIFSVL